uniref:Protein Abitram n=1 Tax=Polytomella parva TaxID=51329 RepID=A0A7S0V3U8_9CHLO|mmetsp:Transcript_29667/g.54404  ORF Transcript_29667/g.54404 Transcript_29667/m.54404 type:complete len:387 (+) Transcript_29667:125-1285(+)
MAGYVNDWMEHTSLLPPRPRTFIEQKYRQYFMIDCNGHPFHDQYIFVAPNGLCVIGLAPSHPLIKSHRESSGYKPTILRYVAPPKEIFSFPDVLLPDEDDDGQTFASCPTIFNKVGGNLNAIESNDKTNNVTLSDTTMPTSSNSRPPSKKNARVFDLKNVSRINFCVGSHDWSATKSSGKRRRDSGGNLQARQTLCFIEGISSSILEENDGLNCEKTSEKTGGLIPGKMGEDVEKPRDSATDYESIHVDLKAEAQDDESSLKQEDTNTDETKNVQVQKAKKLDTRKRNRNEGEMYRVKGKEGVAVAGEDEVADLQRFPVVACVPGRLLEVNRRLLDSPQLLFERPCREGFIGIILPKLENLECILKGLMTRDMYLKERNLGIEDLL